MWVSPFRYLRIVGYLLLPEAFRSLSRLSSALSAKASTLRSYSLDLPSCIALQSVGLSHFFEFRSRGCYLMITSSDVFLDISISVCGFQGTYSDTLTGLPVMEMERFELLTPCLQGRCSPN